MEQEINLQNASISAIFQKAEKIEKMKEDTPMMSEYEVKALINNYNETIRNLVLENENLSKRLKASDDELSTTELELSNTKSKNKKLLTEKDHFQGLYENSIKESREKDQRLLAQKATLEYNSLEKKDLIALEENKDALEILEKLNLGEEDKNILRTALKKAEEKDNEIQKLRSLIKVYDIEIQSMNKKLENLEKSKFSIKFCVQCKEQYTTANNKEDSCYHHTGKLKYYSCRGCGADEYYTCCNRCLKCSKGCKHSKHVGLDE